MVRATSRLRVQGDENAEIRVVRGDGEDPGPGCGTRPGGPETAFLGAVAAALGLEAGPPGGTPNGIKVSPLGLVLVSPLGPIAVSV